MNTTLRDILWWIPMWSAMFAAGLYLGRKLDTWPREKTVRFAVCLVIAYVLWPILGAIIFTYG